MGRSGWGGGKERTDRSASASLKKHKRAKHPGKLGVEDE